MRRALILALAASAALPAAATAATVRSGPLTVTARDGAPLLLTQTGGPPLRLLAVLRDGADAGPLRDVRADGTAITASAGPLGLRIEPAGDGSVRLTTTAPGGATMIGASFAAETGERFFGTGERSDAVERSGRETEHYVADGPFRAEDREYVRPLSPPWAARERDDATYYPVPWALSSRGWGALVEEDRTSRLRARDTTAPDRWALDVDGASMRLRVFAGPTPARALARFTAATGRQPAPAAPWTYGPWFQTGQPNVVPVQEEREITRAQRAAGVPVSVAETQMHYLPCGAHVDRRAAEQERAASFHRDGLARLVYFNPLLCRSYSEVHARAEAAGVLQRTAGGSVFSYPAFVGGAAPAGFSEEPLSQFDFTHPATEGFVRGLVAEAVQDGADGWMEDFGESTPPVVVQHDGSTGDAAHNRYPTDFHCTFRRIALSFDRPLVRHQRSGWTGSARCAEVVWGGDPTTVWGFDGISSVVTQALSIGLSGVARYGTDIGGYNSFGAGSRGFKPGETEEERLTPEMLDRWIELGALLPVMRTKRTGIAIPSYDRPQVFDPEHLPVWRAMAGLHHRLNPYLQTADEEHRRSGLPIVRHLVLAHPGLERARTADDEYLLGPDLLAAPVVTPGTDARRLWLPPGRWVDWFRSVDEDATLHAPHVLRGGADVTLPAPRGQPPLLARVGAVLPLLPEGIDTLTGFGRAAGLTRLADRPDHLRLLAWPRGATCSRLPGGGTARSTEGRRRWVLRVTGARRTRYDVQATLSTLRRPFRPRVVLAGGRPLPRARWSYDARSKVLRASVRGKIMRLEVRA